MPMKSISSTFDYFFFDGIFTAGIRFELLFYLFAASPTFELIVFSLLPSIFFSFHSD